MTPIQNVDAYRNMLELMDHAQAVEGIRRGLDSMARGEGRSAEEVFESLRKRHQIPVQPPLMLRN